MCCGLSCRPRPLNAAFFGVVLTVVLLVSFAAMYVKEKKRRTVQPILDGRFSTYIQALIHVEGGLYSFKGREHYLPLVNAAWDTLLLRTARQVEKSSSLAIALIVPCIMIPRYRGLYLVPSWTQAKEFSESKLSDINKGSPWILKNRLGKGCKDSVILKTYSNRSRIDLRYAFYTADRTRGIKADVLCIDELQDILQDNIPVAEQTLKHSQPPPGYEHLAHMYKRKMLAGTPKSNQNPIESYWRGSTQCEWIVPCQTCKKWNVLNTRKHIGPTGPICMYCKRAVDAQAVQAHWHANNPEGSSLGFHISTLMVPVKGIAPPEMRPWLDWKKDVLEPAGMIKGSDGYPEVQFQNEVLGLPCDDAATAITQEEVKLCCKSDWHFVGHDDHIARTTRLYAGIDWGEARPSKTVLTIGGFFEQNRFSLIYIKSFSVEESNDPLEVVRECIRICTLYRVAAIGCDKGHGWTANPMMAEAFTWDRVLQFQYVVGTAKRLEFAAPKHQWSVNRTQLMSEFFLDIKRDRIRLPSWPEFQPYHKDLTNIFVEYSNKLRTQTFGHNPGENDDAAHSILYAKLAGDIYISNFGWG